MKTWMKRFGCLLFILFWLFFISLPGIAFVLAAEQQIQIGQDPQNHWRVFLIQEAHAEGLGSEWIRPASAQPYCTQTKVNYLMWLGDSENVSFCQCFDAQTNELMTSESGSCRQ